MNIFHRKSGWSTAITSIASKAITGFVAIAQASETTKAIAKATAVASAVAHCVRAWGFVWILKVTAENEYHQLHPYFYTLHVGVVKPQHTCYSLKTVSMKTKLLSHTFFMKDNSRDAQICFPFELNAYSSETSCGLIIIFMFSKLMFLHISILYIIMIRVLDVRQLFDLGQWYLYFVSDMFSSMMIFFYYLWWKMGKAFNNLIND